MSIESLKLVYNDDIKKTKKIPTTFEALKELIAKSFEVPADHVLKVYFKDEEGDNVLIGNQNDFAELLENVQDTKSLRLLIKAEHQKSQFENPESSEQKNLKEAQELEEVEVIDEKPENEHQSPVEEAAEKQGDISQRDTTTHMSFEEPKDSEEEIPASKEEEHQHEDHHEELEDHEEELDHNEPTQKELITKVAGAFRKFRNAVFSKFKSNSQQYFKKYRRIVQLQVKEVLLKYKQELDENKEVGLLEKKKMLKMKRAQVVSELYEQKTQEIEQLDASNLPSIEALEQEQQQKEVPVMQAKAAYWRGKQEAQAPQLSMDKEELRNTVASIVSEMVPMIAAKVTQKLSRRARCERRGHHEEQTTEQRPPRNDAVHENVTCDGCGKYPISGPRFKCSVCENFDYCKECEKNKSHPHPFLKIRTPEQAPKFLFTAINDDQEEEKEAADQQQSAHHNFFEAFGGHHGHHGHHGRHHRGEGRGFGRCFGMNPFIKNLQEQYKNNEEFRNRACGMAQNFFGINLNEVVKNFFPQADPETQQQGNENSKPEISYEFVKVVSKSPELITTESTEVSFKLLVRNNGSKQWPEKSVLSCELTESYTELPALKPNEEAEITMSISNKHGVSGNFAALITFGYQNGQEVELIGQMFEVPFEVVEAPKKVEEQPKVMDEKQGLSAADFEKVVQLQQLFGDSIDFWVSFVKKYPGMSVEELASTYLG